jgi:hypothetical protein
MKKIDTFKLHTFLKTAWICCYGLAIAGLLSLFLLIAPDEFLEKDSKGYSAPVKQALATNPKLIFYTIGISSISGGIIYLLDKKLEKKA